MAFLYIGLVAFDLFGEWKRGPRRRTFWAVIGLHAAGVAFAMAVLAGFEPLSPFEYVRALLQPVGAAFLKPLSGGS